VIAELPADFREALVAIDVLGLSYREASRALRVREATITTRLYRARQRVAHELQGKEAAAAGVIADGER
jgi:RNA polymerase sigma-70 factor (ECF subfamily)